MAAFTGHYKNSPVHYKNQSLLLVLFYFISAEVMIAYDYIFPVKNVEVVKKGYG